MSSKDDKKTGLSITKELTHSLTASSVESMNPSVEELLGDVLSAPSEPHVLIRLTKGQGSQALAKSLKLPVSEGIKLESGQYVPLVLGPYKLERIRGLVEAGNLGPGDFILSSNNRWKSLKEQFPDLYKRGFEGDENSKTGTQTAYEYTQTHTADGTSNLDGGGLKLEPVEDAPRPSEVVLEDVNKDAPETVFHQPRATPPRTKATVKGGSVSKWRESPELTKKVSFFVGYVLVFLGFIYFINTRWDLSLYWHNFTRETFRKNEDSAKKDVVPQQDWPAHMKPITLNQFSQNDSALVAKVRPILTAITLGRTQLSDTELKTLKSVADPASANWEARLLSVNQLAATYIIQNRLEDAQKVLLPVLQSATTDTVTLMNGSLLFLAQKDLVQARDLAASAQRLCTASYCWVAFCLSALVEAADGRFTEAEKFIKDALSRSPNNPLVHGLWLRVVSMTKPAKYLDQMKVIFESSLWDDPDYWWDSPIPAPLAGGIFRSQALNGFQEAFQKLEGQLSGGQQSYFRWLLSRLQNDPFSESAASLAAKLETEEMSLSQLLSAYLYKESGDFNRAASVLSKLLPLLKMEKIKSSWPWVLTADVQFERGLSDQSMLLYTVALSRNSQDRAAVHGLALGLRAKSDWSGASQKFTETLSLDSFFMPAKLRLSRIEWQKLVPGE